MAVEQQTARGNRQMKTYFMVAGNFCKIGKSVDPDSRIKGVQTGCPQPVQIARVFDGDLESHYHRKFNTYAHRGEWFKIEGTLAQFLGLDRMDMRKSAEQEIPTCHAIQAVAGDRFTSYAHPMLYPGGEHTSLDVDIATDHIAESVCRVLLFRSWGEYADVYEDDNRRNLRDKLWDDLHEHATELGLVAVAVPRLLRGDRALADGTILFWSNRRLGTLADELHARADGVRELFDPGAMTPFYANIRDPRAFISGFYPLDKSGGILESRLDRGVSYTEILDQRAAG